MEKWKFKIILAFALLAMVNICHAEDPIFKKELTREIHEIFDVSSDVLVGVHNKYGDVSINTWDKNQVKVDVYIKVKTNNQDKAKRFLDGINIKFSTSSNKIGMVTEYPDQNNSSWWGGWWSSSSNMDYEVNYKIMAPEGMSSNLINKYGNISQTSIKGSTEVVNKYGDIYLEDIGESLTLGLGYGKAKVGYANEATMQIKYSEVKLESCGDITMTSKYSDFVFGDCGNMILDSKYDEFSIQSANSIRNEGKYDDIVVGTLGSILIDTKYSDIRIGKLLNKANFDTSYGSVKIKSNDSAEKIVIDARYTDYRIGLDSDFHLDFDGSYSSLSVDKPYEKYDYDKDGSSLKAKLYRGSKSAKLQIVVEMKYGGLNIKPSTT